MPFRKKERNDEVKPKKDHVKNNAAHFRIGEDFELAHRLQNGEFEEHFGLNRHERKSVRENLIAAKVIQNEEEYRLQEERMEHLQRLRSLEDSDQEAARRYQKQLLEETARERDEELVRDRRHAMLEQERFQREANEAREEIELLDEQIARREEARLRSEDVAQDSEMARRVAEDLKAQDAAELQLRADNDENYARALFNSLRLEERNEARRAAESDRALARSLSMNDQPGGDVDIARELQDEEIARLLQEREIKKFRRRQLYMDSDGARGRVFSDGDHHSSEPTERSYRRSQSDNPHTDYQGAFPPQKATGVYGEADERTGYGQPGRTRRYERTKVVQRTENGRTTEERHRELEFTDDRGQTHRQHHREMKHYTGPRHRAPPPPIEADQQLSRAELPPPLPARNGLQSRNKDSKSKRK